MKIERKHAINKLELPISKNWIATLRRCRHVSGSGFERDAEKRNAAVLAGWRVLHFTPRHIRSGTAVRMIETLMRTIR